MITYYNVSERVVIVDKKRTLIGIWVDNSSKGLLVMV